MNTVPIVKFFITEIGKSLSGAPIAVGWDYCKCGYHISICQCASGPTEPVYITKMRERETQQLVEAARSAVATPVVSKKSEVAVPLATQQGTSAGNLAPACITCNKAVDESNADRQDDGTYLCFDCQEAS